MTFILSTVQQNMPRVVEGFLYGAGSMACDGEIKFKTSQYTRDRAAFLCATFVGATLALSAKAIELIGPERFGTTLALSMSGAGVGFREEDKLDVPVDPGSLRLVDRDGNPMRMDKRGENTIGRFLDVAAYGTYGSIAPWAYPSFSLHKGVLQID